MISPDFYGRAKTAFLAVCDAPERERGAALDRACPEPELRRLVEEMLQEDRATLSTLDGHAAALPTAASMKGRRIGQYTIRAVIGEGGMGVVYEAEQENPRRIVALKLIRPEFATGTALQRFRHEAQALGRLQHPGIAQIHEAGQAGGTQFFAMELIRGVPVLDFARRESLDIPALVELVARIADAVHHAHQKGVIHRDLKPANILVEEGGRPKVLDFGIARILDEGAPVHTLQTSAGQLIGTVAYMSPEQAAGDPAAIDTRTDVYALGLILYELLAGQRPYNLSETTLHDSLRIIRETEPVPLGSLDRRFRGDFETIAAHALEKDRDRRYPSAAELATDLRRTLRHEPIHARPATTVYQLRKFARRHSALVGGGAAVVTALLLGLLGVTLALQRAITAREAEASQRRITEAVNLFLNEDLLAAVSPYEMGRDVTMRAVLDDAAKHIEGRFDKDPLVEAAIRSTIGRAYWQLGELQLAEPHLVRALELRQRHLKQPTHETAESLTRLGHLHRNRGEFERAEPLYREALKIREKLLGETAPLYITSLVNLAGLYREHGDWDRALPLCERAMELARRSMPPGQPERTSAQENLAGAYKDLGRSRESVALYEEVLQIRRDTQPADHPDILRVMNSLAVSYRAAGEATKAISLLEESLVIRRRVMGARHPEVLPSMTNLASAYMAAGKFDQAEPLFRESIDLSREIYGDDHRGTLIPMVGLGRLLRLTSRFSEAEPLLTHALEGFRRVQGPASPRTLDTMNELAALYIAQDRFDQAEPITAAALDGSRKALPADHPNLASVLRTRADCLKGLGRKDEADAASGEADRITASRASGSSPDASRSGSAGPSGPAN